jgi:hypothetical protein
VAAYDLTDAQRLGARVVVLSAPWLCHPHCRPRAMTGLTPSATARA